MAAQKAGNTGEFAWEPLRNSSLSVRIRGQILAFLADGDLRGGDRLPSERELAARLEVSRPSVREAIKTLEAEGRLEVRHGQGIYVTSTEGAPPIDAALASASALHLDLDEVFGMREVLEVAAARWAAERADPDSIARVREAHQRLLAASEKEPTDFAQLHLLDASFHQSIVQAAGNRFLEQTQGVLGEILVRGMTTTLTVAGRLEASRRDHEAILAAIVSGDGQRAEDAARAHVRAAHQAARSRAG